MNHLSYVNYKVSFIHVDDWKFFPALKLDLPVISSFVSIYCQWDDWNIYNFSLEYSVKANKHHCEDSEKGKAS